ncbi:hypothetical protein GUITHDRAFT_150576 [Guillardia theta CCMP2712]|uniref:Uncharacterized protein n=3 Tax=Guillardia theta TaxID=55529 RepID=L1JWP9_GUITC|nr:hypothetical protein GUITHDRAFT_150576 [Guillardia theta CCMP2712]EKX52528.1 hypothetical protein GUITHDRAFT_150576 [Guillardia theta CCMP2712]|mmetsp:Transcript_20903/g.69805  ORF Transcript_20903/g.69805 Transcript_20903/m.69805 type:complete len:132 (+) Transcript_20903:98-493(+)|eukprot:XP_005839508.1 hypothetical protein GUITHDRAFT_150576 [Guillardia theta CCMP2712]
MCNDNLIELRETETKLATRISGMIHITDLYFYDELRRTKGPQEAGEWLLSQTKSCTTTNSTATSSPTLIAARAEWKDRCHGKCRLDCGDFDCKGSYAANDIIEQKNDRCMKKIGSKIGLLFTDAAHLLLQD